MSERPDRRADWDESLAAMARIDAALAKMRAAQALDDYCAVTGMSRADALTKLLRGEERGEMNFAEASAMVQVVAPSKSTVQVDHIGASTEYRLGDRVATVYSATTGAFGLRINEKTDRVRWRWHGGKFCGAWLSESEAKRDAVAWCRDGAMPSGAR